MIKPPDNAVLEEKLKLLFIRHGEPDYTIDSLTEKGWREAEYLSERIAAMDIKDFYVSPLGRARDTASVTLKKTGRTAKEYEWLREFNVGVIRPGRTERSTIAWDWLPADWMKDERFFAYDKWWETPAMLEANAKGEYDWVTGSFDKLLAEHGSVREKHFYRVERSNEDTLAFFCHFGVTCVFVSHLLGISPMILWHEMFSAPTSVTTLITEERQKGIASFRLASFGDVSHLYVKNEPASFSGRFCEVFDSDERH